MRLAYLVVGAVVAALPPAVDALHAGAAAPATPAANARHCRPATHSHSRRASLRFAAAVVGSTLLAPHAAWTAQVLDLDDELSAPAPTSSLQPQPVAIQTVDANAPKKKKPRGAYERIKELQAQGQLTDKERKELKRLKQEEMCEMLGKGC